MSIDKWAHATAKKRREVVEAARKRNREEMPQVAEWTDMTRKTFPQARVVCAKENGKEVGRFD